MKKIKELIKEYKTIILIGIIINLIVHLPLFTKNILTADVLLNTGYYSGYSWEISLGRFGLYFIGLLKGFVVIPQIEIFLSILLLIASIILIFDLFEIKNKLVQLLVTIIVSVSPIVSATLLFHYCSFPYFLAFFSGILAIWILTKVKHKVYKYILPIGLIALSLSMYQAYLAIPITLLLLFWMIKIIKKDFKWKDFFLSFGMIIIGTILYYVLMKLSLIIFQIDLNSYRGANTLSIKTILEIPSRILNSYQNFYDFYFTNNIVNNSNVFLNILNIFLLIFLIICCITTLIRKKISWKYCLLFIILLLLLPIAINIITILLPNTSMQLLMSSGYLLIFFLLAYLVQKNKISKIIFIILAVIISRGYIIQDNATYQTLENTYYKTHAIASDIKEEIKNLDYNKDIMITGSLDQNEYYMKTKTTELKNISKLTYGFVSNYSLFWSEFTNMKNGWSRFMETYLDFPITFVDLETYQKILETNEYKDMKPYPNKDSIQEIDNVIVIKLSN